MSITPYGFSQPCLGCNFTVNPAAVQNLWPQFKILTSTYQIDKDKDLLSERALTCGMVMFHMTDNLP